MSAQMESTITGTVLDYVDETFTGRNGETVRYQPLRIVTDDGEEIRPNVRRLRLRPGTKVTLHMTAGLHRGRATASMELVDLSAPAPAKR